MRDRTLKAWTSSSRTWGGGGNNSSHFTKLLRKNEILPTKKKCFINRKVPGIHV